MRPSLNYFHFADKTQENLRHESVIYNDKIFSYHNYLFHKASKSLLMVLLISTY